jgi:hypothetical protein
MNSILQNKMRLENHKPDKNLSLRKLGFNQENSTKNAVQEFHLRFKTTRLRNREIYSAGYCKEV